MSAPPDQAVYRVRRFSRRGGLPRDYRGSYEVLDENTSKVLSSCDVLGNALFVETAITDANGGMWTLTPNRKLLPTRWLLRDASRSVVVQFDQSLPRKLANPLHRVLLTLLDGHERELFRVIDPRQSTADRILGVGPNEWAVLRGENVAGKIVWLRRDETPTGGFLQKVRNFLASSDRGVVSASREHVLAAPVALAMLIVVNELTASASA